MQRFKDFIQESDDEPVRITLRGGFNTSRRSEEFMDELHDTTQEHPFDERSRIFGNHATIHVSQDGGSSVRLHDVRALTPGGGAKAIEHLKSLADKHGVEINGTAKAYSRNSKYPMNTKQLTSYYKKRGFTVHPGGDNHYGHDITYTPKPKES